MDLVIVLAIVVLLIMVLGGNRVAGNVGNALWVILVLLLIVWLLQQIGAV
jgi:hypothetical protein